MVCCTIKTKVEQLCLPRGRRCLANDLCHQGHRKTKEKIHHNFYWSDMAKTVKDYVDSCLACQKKARAVVPVRTRTRLGDRAFDVAGPRLWNNLPASLRSTDSIAQFRKQLKTYLFRD